MKYENGIGVTSTFLCLKSEGMAFTFLESLLPYSIKQKKLGTSI